MPAIRIDHVSRDFGTFKALDDVSLHIHDCETVTVVGPSGCGKSTLLRIIAGLEQPTSGNVWIDEQIVNHVNDALPKHRYGVSVLRALSAPDLL